MESFLSQLPGVLTAVWWPFCRVMAMLSAAPVMGESTVPMTVRVLLALVLAVILVPVAQPAMNIEPLSVQALLVTVEQLLIGFGIGLAFYLTVATTLVLGFIVSSQMGLSMGVMNDPLNGTSSDVVSNLLYLLSILVFFSIDGHLVLAGVVGGSFHSFPVGAGMGLGTLQSVAAHAGWVFSAALLLAVPVIFSGLVVQLGFGFLNRAAPALNLYSLGFSVVTLFGLTMLGYLLRTVPEHYLRMMNQALELLEQAAR